MDPPLIGLAVVDSVTFLLVARSILNGVNELGALKKISFNPISTNFKQISRYTLMEFRE